MRTGRPKTPEHLLSLRQSKYAADKDAMETPKPIQLAMPPHMSERAQDHWTRIVPPLIAAGRLRKEDETALELLCIALDKSETSTDEEKRLWQKQAMEFLQFFGATPLGRARGGFPNQEPAKAPESRPR